MLNLRNESLSASKHRKLPSINNNQNKNNNKTNSNNNIISDKSSELNLATSNLLETSYLSSSNLISGSAAIRHIENTFELEVNETTTNKTNYKAILDTELSNLSNTSLLPKTDNKKKAPQKIETINPQSFNHKIINRQHLSTTVTIDILSESDRFSRLSLDPLTYRETSSSRISSVSSCYFFI